MSKAESDKFLGVFDKETIKKVAKYGVFAIGLLGLISLL